MKMEKKRCFLLILPILHSRFLPAFRFRSLTVSEGDQNRQSERRIQAGDRWNRCFTIIIFCFVQDLSQLDMDVVFAINGRTSGRYKNNPWSAKIQSPSLFVDGSPPRLFMGFFPVRRRWFVCKRGQSKTNRIGHSINESVDSLPCMQS
ncbi:hypothetical protein L1987_21354 [Smallanthus sonchifolius]|uniref:Uncharacterized protein n=1 Tax=Smallanthus sonchifolius TaxID=185202 RepID=A0ACB9ITR9_9ASTR|nr:hypothetical protein L1987_21354 [Smallanthus sonchifolius]